MELSVLDRESIFFVIPDFPGEAWILSPIECTLCGETASKMRDKSLGFLGVVGLESVASLARYEFSVNSGQLPRNLTR